MDDQDGASACCMPSRAAQSDDARTRSGCACVGGCGCVSDVAAPTSRAGSAHGIAHGIEQRPVPAGTFSMGDAHGDGRAADGERPVRRVALDAFDIDATAVTVADFARFVDATGHVTEAERFGASAVFHLVLDADPDDVVGRSAATPWWLGVRGADWLHPQGRRSTVHGREDHPVVHVSWNDAMAYCTWAGRRLPTEAQWEGASRGGIEGARYPWGDDLLGDDGVWRCNIWQGRFPTRNDLDDGFLTTAPVRSFEPNGFGLWQTVGNVWEWVADAWSADTDSRRPGRTPHDPHAPRQEALRGLRGGSYLCHDSYCNRYRNAARTSNTPDSAAGNVGFRTVAVR